ncbi:MAG: hypothetical protein P1U40_12890 [Coxiellaceae bacterium]|nr:hypothetical protein [Coxiellaceae bacterium]
MRKNNSGGQVPPQDPSKKSHREKINGIKQQAQAKDKELVEQKNVLRERISALQKKPKRNKTTIEALQKRVKILELRGKHNENMRDRELQGQRNIRKVQKLGSSLKAARKTAAAVKAASAPTTMPAPAAQKPAAAAQAASAPVTRPAPAAQKPAAAVKAASAPATRPAPAVSSINGKTDLGAHFRDISSKYKRTAAQKPASAAQAASAPVTRPAAAAEKPAAAVQAASAPATRPAPAAEKPAAASPVTPDVQPASSMESVKLRFAAVSEDVLNDAGLLADLASLDETIAAEEAGASAPVTQATSEGKADLAAEQQPAAASPVTPDVQPASGMESMTSRLAAVSEDVLNDAELLAELASLEETIAAEEAGAAPEPLVAESKSADANAPVTPATSEGKAEPAAEQESDLEDYFDERGDDVAYNKALKEMLPSTVGHTGESGAGFGSCASATVDVPNPEPEIPLDPVYVGFVNQVCDHDASKAEHYTSNPPQLNTIKHDGQDMQVMRYQFHSKEAGQQFHEAMKNAYPDQAELFDKLNPQYADKSPSATSATSARESAVAAEGKQGQPGISSGGRSAAMASTRGMAGAEAPSVEQGNDAGRPGVS